jgi:hypothetical protein
VAERSPEEVQREIEQARDALASAVDQLTVRANPKRLADDAKTTLVAKAQTPAGMAVIGATGLLVVVLIVKRFRKS